MNLAGSEDVVENLLIWHGMMAFVRLLFWTSVTAKRIFSYTAPRDTCEITSLSNYNQCLIQDKISTSPSPTDRRAVVTPRGRRDARSSRRTVFTLGDIFT